MNRRDEINRVARLLIAVWERVESPVNMSYIATFVDMARAVVDDYLEKEGAISWGTSCLNCASLLDQSYSDYVRAERAEERVRELESAIEQLRMDNG